MVQKLLIKEGQFEDARASIAARRARCRSGEWLCKDVCAYLEGMLPPLRGARETEKP